MPKLTLDRIAKPALHSGGGKQNHFFPLSDPDRGRKAFIRNLGLTQHEKSLLGK